MKIIVKSVDPTILELEFTKEELLHPSFTTVLNRMRNKDSLEVHKTGGLVSVEVIDSDSYQTIGLAVDEVRNLWMGDIPNQTPPSDCPRFGFTPEPILNLEEELL
jgi:hypothetical protein